MFVVSKCNIVVPSKDGMRTFPMPKGFMGEVPDWVTDTRYFAELVKDGKVGVPNSKKDKDIQELADNQVPRRKKQN